MAGAPLIRRTLSTLKPFTRPSHMYSYSPPRSYNNYAYSRPSYSYYQPGYACR
jgi:hypothetical protein